MDVRNIENTPQTWMNGDPKYAITAVASVSESATSDERTYTFSARVLLIQAPRCEVWAIWYKGELQPRLYQTRNTAIARAKRLIRADVKALKEGRKAPC